MLPRLLCRFPGVERGDLVVVRLARVVQRQIQALPARDGVLNLALAQPPDQTGIMVRLAAPACLNPLEVRRDFGALVHLIEHQRAALKAERFAHCFATPNICSGDYTQHEPI